MKSPHRLFAALAVLFGLGFACATPPCYVPDEVAHFWRAASIAHGTLNPTDGRAPLPKGYQLFVFVLMHGQTQITRADLATAWAIDAKPNELVELSVVPSSYTPANYLPQILAALIGRITGMRPMLVFYLGRLFALAAFVALVAYAIRVTPVLKWAFCAAALLPMTLFMAASWSADAMTIALAFLVTALALRGAALAPVAAFLLGLCKPVYFLVSFVSRRWLVPVAAFAGFGVLLLLARATPAPSSQWRCIADDPPRFARVVLHDFAASTPAYLEQMVGRLGQLDVVLPRPLIWLEWLLLAALVITAGERIPRPQRLTALAVSVALILSVGVWMYLTWTPTCGAEILGIQGRYYLPILPPLFVALANPWWRWGRAGWVVVGGVALIANAVAVAMVAMRYYGL